MNERETDETRDENVEESLSTAQLAAQGGRDDGDDAEPDEQESRRPLFAGEDADRFREQWQEIRVAS
jgi:hypothetical protein